MRGKKGSKNKVKRKVTKAKKSAKSPKRSRAKAPIAKRRGIPKRKVKASGKNNGSAFSRAIEESYERRKRMYRSYNAPKRALAYTNYSAKYLKKGKLPIPPSYSYKSKYTVTKHWQFYGPLAWVAMERVLDVLRSQQDVQVGMVEFSTGYTNKDERIGTSWSTPIELPEQARIAAHRPSAEPVFRRSELAARGTKPDTKDFKPDDSPIESARFNGARSTNYVYIDVYAKVFTLAAKRKYEI